MKRFREFITELKILRYLHIGPDNLKPGQSLLSMSARLGKKEGRAAYLKKWQPLQGNENMAKHADYVHLADPKQFSSTETHYDEKKKKWYDKPKATSVEADFMKDAKFYGSGGSSYKKGPKMALYDVRPGRQMKNKPKMQNDPYDAAHPVVKGEIPGRYIRNKWNPATKKWERFK